jgi:predicted lipase
MWWFRSYSTDSENSNPADNTDNVHNASGDTTLKATHAVDAAESNIQPSVSGQDIDHCVLLDLLRITLLIYDFGKTFAVKEAAKVTDADAAPTATIEEFVNQLQQQEQEQEQTGGAGADSPTIFGGVRRRALGEMAKNAPKARVHLFVDDENTDVQAAVTVAEGQKRICVVFRGSESRSDWYYDLMLFKRRLPHLGHSDVSVHSGFHTQLTEGGTYNNIAASVRELLDENPDFSVYVTGHSLGGALSTLFGFMFSHEVSVPVVVASFASPRVGNYKWKEAFEAKPNLYHYRVTNKRDVVTAFPVYRYYHVGDNIQLADTERKCFARNVARGWFDESIFTCWSPSEHDCELYYKRLTNNTW